MNREHVQAFQEATQSGALGIMENEVRKAQGRFALTVRATGHVVGALSALAIIVGHEPGEESMAPGDFNPASRLTDDRLLFAALLAAASVHCNHREAKIVAHGVSAATMECNFGKEAIFNALELFEHMTGRKIDDKINPGMVKAAREGADEGAVMLSQFLGSGKPN